jgi:hypothetical protein
MNTLFAPELIRPQAVDSVVAYLQLLRNLPQTRLGVIGDGSGNVTVSDRTKFFYVRLGGTDGDVAEARSLSLLNPADGDTVLLRRERPGGTGSWVIVEWYGAGVPPLDICDEGCTGVLGVLGALLWESGAYGNAIVKQGNYIFGIAELSTPYNALVVMDVSNPASPSVAYSSGDLGWSASNVDFFLSFGYIIVGTWLYVVGRRTDFHVHAIDLSTPTAPVDSFTWNIPTIDSLFYPPPVWSAGGTNYMVVTGGGSPTHLYVVSFAPSTGSIVGTVDIPGSDFFDYMVYANGYVYGLSDFNQGDIYIVTISTPASPTIALVSGVIPNVDFVDVMTARGTTLYVAYANALSGDYEVASVDISTPTAPVLLDTIVITDEAAWMDSCSTHVYVATDRKLQSIDISNPSSLSITDTLTLPANFHSESIPYQSLIVENGAAYLTGRDAGTSNHPKLVISSA